MARTVTTAALTTGTWVLVEAATTTYAAGQMVPARRKTATVARVLEVKSGLVGNFNSSSFGRQRMTRRYTVVTTAGVVADVAGVQTFWLAPEDTAAVNRAHVEALAEDAERDAAAPAVVEEAPAAAAAAEQAEGDDLDGMTFAQVMVLAKAFKVPGRGVARIAALREGVRAARAAV